MLDHLDYGELCTWFDWLVRAKREGDFSVLEKKNSEISWAYVCV